MQLHLELKLLRANDYNCFLFPTRRANSDGTTQNNCHRLCMLNSQAPRPLLTPPVLAAGGLGRCTRLARRRGHLGHRDCVPGPTTTRVVTSSGPAMRVYPARGGAPRATTRPHARDDADFVTQTYPPPRHRRPRAKSEPLAPAAAALTHRPRWRPRRLWCRRPLAAAPLSAAAAAAALAAKCMAAMAGRSRSCLRPMRNPTPTGTTFNALATAPTPGAFAGRLTPSS